MLRIALAVLALAGVATACRPSTGGSVLQAVIFPTRDGSAPAPAAPRSREAPPTPVITPLALAPLPAMPPSQPAAVSPPVGEPPVPLPTMPPPDASDTLYFGRAGDWWEVLFSSGTKELGEESQAIARRLSTYINLATRSIHIAAFETDIDEIADALIAAHNRGVDVRWITDDENGTDADAEEGRGQFARMEAAGIPIRDDQRSALMHNKFIIFDEAILWTGSMNLTWNDLGRNNNNVIVADAPEVAAIYAREFQEMWDGQFGAKSPSTKSTQATALQGTPFIVRFAPEDDPFEQLVALTGAARHSIRFMAFSFTQDDLGQVMLERAAAGVGVSGIFEVRGSETEYAELSPLYCAGLAVRQDGNPGTFHHKVIVIDETVVVTGSMNFSENAASSNDENVIALSNPDIARAYLEEFDRRWAEATEPDPADMACGEG